MSMEIKKAVRKAIPAIIMFYGKSGSGKTYSALKLSKGMISDGKRICVIDTENGRSSHYAEEFDFDVIDLEPPFSPSRYIEAINLAQNTNKYGVIITDSISHEWEGLGGCCDIADGISESLRKKGLSDKGLNIWAKPKSEHKKFTLNNLFRSKVPVICCARAKEDLRQTKVNGKTEIVNNGLIPIQEKNFPYEMLVTFKMEGNGKFILEKSSTHELKSKLSSIKAEFIDERFGKAISDWVSGGEKIDIEVMKLKEDARDVAMNEGAEALTAWFSGLTQEDQIIAKRFNINFKKELLKIAKDRDVLESGEEELSTPKLQNQFNSIVNPNWFQEIEKDFPSVEVKEKIKPEITYEIYDSLLDHLCSCESLSDMESFEKDFHKDLKNLKIVKEEDHTKLSRMIEAKKQEFKLSSKLNINSNQ